MKNNLKFGLTLGILVLALVLASCQSLLEPLPSETTAEESYSFRLPRSICPDALDTIYASAEVSI